MAGRVLWARGPGVVVPLAGGGWGGCWRAEWGGSSGPGGGWAGWGTSGPGGEGSVRTLIQPERVFLLWSKERPPRPGRIGNLEKRCSGRNVVVLWRKVIMTWRKVVKCWKQIEKLLITIIKGWILQLAGDRNHSSTRPDQILEPSVHFIGFVFAPPQHVQAHLPS